MWVCTVRRDKNMPRAMSDVESPRATRAATLTSVGVSASQPEAARCPRRPWTPCLMPYGRSRLPARLMSHRACGPFAYTWLAFDPYHRALTAAEGLDSSVKDREFLPAANPLWRPVDWPHGCNVCPAQSRCLDGAGQTFVPLVDVPGRRPGHRLGSGTGATEGPDGRPWRRANPAGWREEATMCLLAKIRPGSYAGRNTQSVRIDDFWAERARVHLPPTLEGSPWSTWSP